MEHLGIKIRKRRQELGLKVYELAKKIGVNAVYVTQIEKHGKLPSPVVFKRIEKALELDPHFQKLYINKKFPSFNDVLGAVAKEHKTHPEIAEEVLKKIIERGTEMNSRLVAVKLIKEYNPSQKAIREIFTIVSSFYSYLMNENIVEINPVLLIRQKSKYFTKHQGNPKIPRFVV